MANASYVKSLFGGIDATLKRALDQAWDHILTKNLRFGRPTHMEASENLRGYFYTATTPAVADTEFTIAHGLGVVPYLLIPVLALDEGAKLVRLTVTRSADASRVYLSSPDTNAPVTILLEG